MKRLVSLILILFVLATPTVGYASIESGNGIDVSNYQTITDYQAIKDSGIKYAYVKTTEGTNYTDRGYLDKYSNFQSVGIKVGFYHFMSEWTDPSDQAEYFYNSIKGCNYDLIPCLDIETNQRCFSSEQLSQRVIQFCDKFKELSGRDIIIYSGSYFSRTYFTQQLINKYQLWIAHYYVDTPTVAAGTNLVGHQFSENYLVSGVGYVDADIFTNAIELNTSVSDVLNSNTTNYSTVVSFDQYKQYREYVGSRCKELQTLLNQYGYSLVVDGDYGACTHKALGDFQGKYLSYVDYMAGEQTFNALYNNLESNWTKKVQAFIGATQDGVVGSETLSKVPTLRYGSNGELVKLLQERLKQYGFYSGKIDGDFGSLTAKALKAYQVNRGLVADGVCGKISWRQLML
ncbi:MAG: GH25 family lysozyme [Bacillota bacterium]|nr:GH25 family lysozyme [Bacillota bacterium]